ncbi:molybdenum cofactor biosynthesis F family protein [Pseudomonas chlororaphis]|uniref:molybdenum cofactor biosynthesis F family protein n=1 Tax=Pseudomonas chlororaphis TaxID=587753 RepID=UPI002365BCFC|nr:molybdenum cofactor biosynthesis F family protein [Pseudomonas chlororaphis]WDH20179.1 molybdenum cofactor biosynthesis F family protein [Pseudomonas chlororaphis]
MNLQPEWITVGALAEGFAADNHILPSLDDLNGRSLTLHFANGWRIEHLFGSRSLHWRDTESQASGETTYRATSIRSGIYLVDFLKSEKHQIHSVSLILDLGRNIFTAVIGQMPSQAETRVDLFSRALSGRELTSVQAQFIHGSIDTPLTASSPQHALTEELVGLHNQYVYSATEAYEHVYLNRNFYSWQCLKGVEQGLADTDRCHYYKLAEQLYLFVWREKIVPTLGLVLIDLQAGRTDGKIFGYQGSDFAAPSNFPVGALAHVLNRTAYV